MKRLINILLRPIDPTIAASIFALAIAIWLMSIMLGFTIAAFAQGSSVGLSAIYNYEALKLKAFESLKGVFPKSEAEVLKALEQADGICATAPTQVSRMLCFKNVMIQAANRRSNSYYAIAHKYDLLVIVASLRDSNKIAANEYEAIVKGLLMLLKKDMEKSS